MENETNNYSNIVVSLKGDSSGWDIMDKPPSGKSKGGKVNNIMVSRYKNAYNKLYDELPRWKQVAVNKCKKNNIQNDSLYDEFIHNVVILAESQAVL